MDGLLGVVKHFYKAYDQATKVNRCISSIGSGQQVAASEDGAPCDYTQLFQPPGFTTQPLQSDNDGSQAEADAAIALAETAAAIAALNTALGETHTRIFQASQAEAWNDAARQVEQYRNYERVRADRIDAPLDVLADDPTFTPADYTAYLAQLKASGLPADQVWGCSLPLLLRGDFGAIRGDISFDGRGQQYLPGTTAYLLPEGKRQCAQAAQTNSASA